MLTSLLMNDLHYMLKLFVFVYLDDILFFSTDERDLYTTYKKKCSRDFWIISCMERLRNASFMCHQSLFWDSFWLRVRWERTLRRFKGLRSGQLLLLQRFLGFANFYQKFIRNFSFIAARVHALTSSKSNFTWNPQAKKAIQHLKKCLISGIAAVLVLLDPSLQFVMEVDVSDLGIGAALSQRSVKGNKSHPGASQIIKIWSISRLPRERVNSH